MKNQILERTKMTFDLVRIGWPNTAAILALAVMPILALTAGPDRHPSAVQLEQTEPAAVCVTMAECSVVAAAAAPETVLE
jgi:hypothetical protein